MENLPISVPVSDIKKTNSEYNSTLISTYNACYEGGSAFNRIIDNILIPREVEVSKPKVYDLRKKRSDYINRSGGLIDFLRASVFKIPPTITSEPESEYWEDLNKNADGLGTPLPQLARDALLSMLLFKRAYLLADFNNDIFDPSNEDSGKAVMRVLSAEIVDDWMKDSNGKLEWIRIHVVEKRRDGIQQSETDTHIFKYIDAYSIATYEVQVKSGASIDSGKEAILISNTKHEFGQIPVFEIDAGTGQWVMDRIFPVVKSLFNRESALTWQLDRQAFSQLILTLNNPERINYIMSGETTALVLEQGEGAEYLTAQSTGFDEQFKDVDRLVKSLYEVVNSLAINAAATQTQNARQSAAAKEMDRSPLEVLLASFSIPIISAINGWIDAVKNYRNESGFEVKLIGLDDFSATMEDIKNIIEQGDENGRITENSEGGEGGEEEIESI